MRLWIDDTGEKEYGPKASRFFAYCGVAVSLENEQRVIDSFNKLKLLILGTDEPEIKSNWLRRPEEVQRRYVLKYGIHENDVDTFGRVFYRWILKQPVTLLASVVDKHRMEEIYGERKHYASATAYDHLMQRYHYLLQDRGVRQGQIYMDDMMGITPKGNPHRKLLIAQHASLVKNGSKLVSMRLDRVADWIRFGGSHHHALLQVADLCAYNVLRQFRAYPEVYSFQKTGCESPKYEQFQTILPLFRSSKTGRINGYGIVKFPSK